jgi:uncharacterized membrane protein
MADVQSSQSGIPARASEDRLMVIVVYGLFLAAFLSCGLAGIAGVILAYIKRDEAKGSIWYSHFDNQINAFWGWFILFVAGIPALIIFGLGVLIIGLAFLWLLYRTLKGLVLALENRAFA